MRPSPIRAVRRGVKALGHQVDPLEIRRAAEILRAREVSGWPKRRKLAHAFLRECSHRRLKLAQLLGQLVAFLTLNPSSGCASRSGCSRALTCRGAWARVTIDQLRHLALQNCMGHRASTNIIVVWLIDRLQKVYRSLQSGRGRRLAGRAETFWQAFRTAMPLRSAPYDAAVGGLLGTLSESVEPTCTRSVPMPKACAATCKRGRC